MRRIASLTSMNGRTLTLKGSSDVGPSERIPLPSDRSEAWRSRLGVTPAQAGLGNSERAALEFLGQLACGLHRFMGPEHGAARRSYPQRSIDCSVSAVMGPQKGV